MKPFPVIVVFCCLSLLGVFLLPQLPVKLNPSRKIPVVSISFTMQGQSARVVETEATSKLEAMVARFRGVKKIQSYSANGYGRITVFLDEHTDPDLARFEISTMVWQARTSLPPEVSYPYIVLSGTDQETQRAFLRYTVNAPVSPLQIQEYIQDHLKPKLSEIKGIDKIDIAGASRMVYKLTYDYSRLQRHDVSVDELRSAVRSCLDRDFLGIGKIESEDAQAQWIRVALLPESNNLPFDPALIRVKNSAGVVLYLDQLVQTTCEEEESSYFRINGLNSVYLSLTAEDATNQLKISNEVQTLMNSLQDSFPAGYEFHLLYDAAEYITAEMNKIYFRAGLTILVLLLFILLTYRNWKYSLLIIVSLLVNLAVAVLFYRLFRLEMQLFSLAGLTISLTLSIDNLIIMSDQILNQGNRKAFLAILAATVTSIGSLAVILFMDEQVRANLQDFAGVIIVNLTISLFISLFFVPALIEQFHIRKRQRPVRFSRKCRLRWLVYFNRMYEKILVFTARRKGWLLALLVLFFGLPVFLLPEKTGPQPQQGRWFAETPETPPSFWAEMYNKTLGSTFYKEHIKPIVDPLLGGTMRLFAQKVGTGSYFSGERSETSLQVTASLPNGATKEQMNALIQKMESYIRQYPEIRQFETYVENGQRASIRILFVPEHQRSRFPHLLQYELISRALELGGGSWRIYGLGDGFDNEIRNQAGSRRIKLLGYNYDELYALAEAVKDSLLLYRRIKEVTIDADFSYYKNDYSEFVFRLDKEKLAQEEIAPIELYRSLTPLFARNSHAADWVYGKQREPVVLTARQSEELDVWNLENYPGKIGSREYKLSDVATIEKWQAPQNIAKENQQYRLCIQFEYIGAYQQAWRITDQAIDRFNRTAPLGYKAEHDSYQYWWREGNSGRYSLLFLIVVVIYFATGILFNSLKQPFVIIFIIPVSFIGLFLTFYLFNLGFDQGGFAALILLTGISVNANIYLLNEYNNIRRNRSGLTPLKAYLKAWNAKIRPVFLTIASTVLGFIPFMVGYREAFWFPLAAGTIGGLLLSLPGVFLCLPIFMGIKKQNIS
ncbi:MAG: efflux RND transporter permease subunit [Culturomica sp.]|jgi:multidrug efflux pump subunit AcrB|nr:efflux RND transporter permease subunit [Culturomica sp.]